MYHEDSLIFTFSDPNRPCPTNEAWSHVQYTSEVTNQTTATLCIYSVRHQSNATYNSDCLSRYCVSKSSILHTMSKQPAVSTVVM